MILYGQSRINSWQLLPQRDTISPRNRALAGPELIGGFVFGFDHDQSGAERFGQFEQASQIPEAVAVADRPLHADADRASAVACAFNWVVS